MRRDGGSGRPVLTIDLGTIRRNWLTLSARVAAGGAWCAAVVKADAYGLGAAAVAPVLAAAGCHRFFVATIDEALSLRAVVPTAEIGILNGLPPDGAGEVREHRLLPVLSTPEDIARWRAHGHGAPAILQIETGLNRLGLDPADAVATLQKALFPVALVMSHLASADDPHHAQNGTQRERFEAVRRALPAPPPMSLAASSGIFLGPAYWYDGVRPGAALYGVNPTPNAANPVEPVVTLSAPILQVRQIDKGEAVGYGGDYVADGPRRIATIPLGYADGWVRSLGGHGTAMIGARPVSIVGRVSMDLITLDVTSIDPDTARAGAHVDLIGGTSGRDLDTVAAERGTIGYEVLTSLGRRFRRVYR